MRRRTTVRFSASRSIKLSPEHLWALRQDLDTVFGVPNTAELCYCACHQGHDIIHSTPCCKRCPHCERNVQLDDFAGHVARHETAGQ